MLESFKKTLNTAIAPVMVVSSDRRLLWVNDSFESSFGYSAGTAPETPRWPCLAPDHEKLFESMTTGALIGPGRAEVIPAMCADGLEKTFRWSTMLLEGDEGSGETAVVFFGTVAPRLGTAAISA